MISRTRFSRQIIAPPPSGVTPVAIGGGRYSHDQRERVASVVERGLAAAGTDSRNCGSAFIRLMVLIIPSADFDTKSSESSIGRSSREGRGDGDQADVVGEHRLQLVEERAPGERALGELGVDELGLRVEASQVETLDALLGPSAPARAPRGVCASI